MAQTHPFGALEAQWHAARNHADQTSERIDQCVASIPEAQRENWTARPQYSDYGVEAAEHALDAACDRLNAAEHAIIGTPAISISDISVKLKVLHVWATMTDEPDALSWLFDAINTDLTRLEGDQLIAA